MDSPQSVVSPFKNSETFEKQNGHGVVQSNESVDKTLGFLKVHVHRARNIHNICIYHKQDVYAKVYLTNEPENTVSTKTINGGGQSPVFDDTLELKVRSFETSVKCEIWMLSRVRNYLQDQLLGFALVPLSEILLENGKLEKEFSLSSDDMFHSPAGFVQLSLSYAGASPEVIAIRAPEAHEREGESAREFENIEFPDPKLENENDQMVTEYLEIPCCDTVNLEESAKVLESLSGSGSGSTSTNSTDVPKNDSPVSSVSTNESQSQTEAQSPPEYASPVVVEEGLKEKKVELNEFKPLISVNFVPEQTVVQQDYVDMYMKSMQQFTESLAKMKLPLDIDNGSPSSGNSSTDQKLETPKSSGSRVFYGSRAFF